MRPETKRQACLRFARAYGIEHGKMDRNGIAVVIGGKATAYANWDEFYSALAAWINSRRFV